MKADHCQSSAWLQALGQTPQGNFQPFQLLVNRDSQRLKRSCCWINAFVATSRHRLADQARQILCRFDSLLAPYVDDMPGDPTAVTLLSIKVNQVCQMLGTKALHEAGRGFAARCIKPQV